MDIKIIKLWGTISYHFSLTINGKDFKELSIECDNYSWEIESNWVDFDDNLYKITNFEEKEQKILDYFEKKFKKQFNNKKFTI